MKVEEMPTTAQGIFDHVVNHLRDQNEKSVLNKSRYGQICAYRSPEGLMCAAGCLIPDELYAPVFENTSIGRLFKAMLYRVSDEEITAVQDKISKLSETYAQHGVLISALQKVHDDVVVPEWEQHFLRISEEYGLRYEPISK